MAAMPRWPVVEVVEAASSTMPTRQPHSPSPCPRAPCQADAWPSDWSWPPLEAEGLDWMPRLRSRSRLPRPLSAAASRGGCRRLAACDRRPHAPLAAVRQRPRGRCGPRSASRSEACREVGREVGVAFGAAAAPDCRAARRASRVRPIDGRHARLGHDPVDIVAHGIP